MGTAWFVDGAYAWRCFNAVASYNSKMDYVALRNLIEADAGESVGDAYFFSADNDPPSAKQNAFHTAISQPPPRGAGLRVKLYWLQRKEIYWPREMGGQPVEHPDTGAQYIQTSQKAVDVGLAFHLIRSFSKKRWNKLYLVAGDSDFHEVVQHLVEDEDVEITLIGNNNSISAELAPYAKRVVNFDSILDQICMTGRV